MAREEVHRRRADEAGHEEVLRVVVELARRVELLQDPGAHDGHAVAEGHGLGLVVGHVDRRRAQAVLEARDGGAHLDAELRVEVRQGLVHEEGGRLADDRAAHGDALALAAGEVGGLAVEVLLEVEDPGRLVDAAVDLLVLLPAELEREADVLPHGHVRVERVALEDHGDVAIARGEVVDDLPADAQLAVGDLLEPGDHPQGRGLPAARGPDEDHELPVLHLEVEALDRLGAVRVPLGHAVEDDVRHGCTLP